MPTSVPIRKVADICSLLDGTFRTNVGAPLHQPIPESVENYYYRLKCEELLCYVFALLVQREALSATSMHINDIKAIYVVKSHLQLHVNQPPNIAALAREAGMSEPKLWKLFKQTFGKGVFEYYQFERMQDRPGY